MLVVVVVVVHMHKCTCCWSPGATILTCSQARRLCALYQLHGSSLNRQSQNSHCSKWFRKPHGSLIIQESISSPAGLINSIRRVSCVCDKRFEKQQHLPFLRQVRHCCVFVPGPSQVLLTKIAPIDAVVSFSDFPLAGLHTFSLRLHFKFQ